MEKLKPCPFCGMELEDYYGDGRKYHHLYNDCILDGEEWWVGEYDFRKKWNYRFQRGG